MYIESNASMLISLTFCWAWCWDLELPQGLEMRLGQGFGRGLDLGLGLGRVMGNVAALIVSTSSWRATELRCLVGWPKKSIRSAAHSVRVINYAIPGVLLKTLCVVVDVAVCLFVLDYGPGGVGLNNLRCSLWLVSLAESSRSSVVWPCQKCS